MRRSESPVVASEARAVLRVPPPRSGTRDQVTITNPAPTAAARTVSTVSGELLTLLTDSEVRWYNDTRHSYMEQLRFTETTDLRDLDRVLLMELLIFRWGNWLAAGEMYDGFEVPDEDKLRLNVRHYSEQITRVKDSMGLSKKVRDDAANDGNFAAYLADLKSRARIFGMHRENQLQKALVLINELFAVLGTYDRSDDEERKKIGFETADDILEWIRVTMRPEYDALDQHFRDHEQRMWTTS